MKNIIDILDYYYYDEYYKKYKTTEYIQANEYYEKHEKLFLQKLSDDLKSEFNDLIDEKNQCIKHSTTRNHALCC